MAEAVLVIGAVGALLPWFDRFAADDAGRERRFARLYLSENTVRGYVQEILHRLSVKNRTEAVMVAVKQGWL